MRQDLLPARHRIGLLIPSSNVTIEHEYYSLMPRAFSFHFNRLPMTALTDEGIRAQTAEMHAAATRLGDARMDFVLFCQTAASFWLGEDWDRQTRATIAESAGAEAITAANTMIGALRALRARRIGMAAPFPADVGQRSIEYLERAGISVVASRFMGIRRNASIADVSATSVAELVDAVDSPEAEAILLPGGNLPCLAVADEIERRIGKPVISTNQAGMWAILTHFGWTEPLAECGILLRDIPKL